MLRQPALRDYVVHQFQSPNPLVPSTPPSLRGDSDLEHGSLTYTLGSHIPDWSRRYPVLKPSGNWLSTLGVNDSGAALGGALAGAMAGGGYGLMRQNGNTFRDAFLGALAGGGGSYLLSNLVRYLNQPNAVKRSYYMDQALSPGPAMSNIQQDIFRDASIGSAEKGELVRLLESLGPEQLRELSSLLRGAGGAGVGLLVARYLLKMGIGGSLIMALAGGVIGSRMGGLPRNVYGERVDPSYDVFGHRHLV